MTQDSDETQISGSFEEFPEVEPAKTDNKNRNIIIGAVAAALVLCCCCMVAVLLVLYNTGDAIFGL